MTRPTPALSSPITASCCTCCALQSPIHCPLAATRPLNRGDIFWVIPGLISVLQTRCFRVLQLNSAGCRVSWLVLRSKVGQRVVMVGRSGAPSFEEVLIDVRTVRDRGIGRLRGLHVPALRRAVVMVDLADAGSDEPAPIVQLLRDAADSLGGGSLQEAAEYSLGLVPGTALWGSRERREHAAQVYGIVAETYRKRPEHEVLGQVAEAILALCHSAHLRAARQEMEQHRHPADSRLAVQWVERFEAYYRIWTPVYALGDNLKAALEVYEDEPAGRLPWQSAEDPNPQPYDPVAQARDYATNALFNLVQYHLELKRFKSQHGGLWLLSDVQVEQDVADAVYRIGWHNNLWEDDEAWLRRHLADVRHEETDHFWQVVLSFPRGERIHEQWQDLVRQDSADPLKEGVRESQAQLTIGACEEYCRLIDEDWMRIADWYRPGSHTKRGVSAQGLYERFIDPALRAKPIRTKMEEE